MVSYTEVADRKSGDAIAMLAFVSGIKTADGRYMIASGQTGSAATLDTLLTMFRTVTRAAAPDPNRPMH